jgi:hypothetical protein
MVRKKGFIVRHYPTGKYLKDIIESLEYENKFGEMMTLVMDSDGELWFKHDDCNNEFENFKDLSIELTYNGQTHNSFKYVLDKDEEKVVIDFISEMTSKVN